MAGSEPGDRVVDRVIDAIRCEPAARDSFEHGVGGERVVPRELVALVQLAPERPCAMALNRSYRFSSTAWARPFGSKAGTVALSIVVTPVVVARSADQQPATLVIRAWAGGRTGIMYPSLSELLCPSSAMLFGLKCRTSPTSSEKGLWLAGKSHLPNAARC